MAIKNILPNFLVACNPKAAFHNYIAIQVEKPQKNSF